MRLRLALSLLPCLTAAACISVLGLEPVELARDAGTIADTGLTPPSDASNTPDGGAVDGGPVPCVEGTPPSTSDACGEGLTGAAATLFGDLRSAEIAVTPAQVYANVAGVLRRYDRALFASGRAVLPTCQGTGLYTFGASDELLELAPFDLNGVCALVRSQGTVRLGCAQAGQDAVIWAQAAEVPDGASAIGAPTHMTAVGSRVYASAPVNGTDTEVILEWNGKAQTPPRVAFSDATGRCPGPGRQLGPLNGDGTYVYTTALTGLGEPNSDDCRGRQVRRFKPNGNLESMLGTSAAGSTFRVEQTQVQPIQSGEQTALPVLMGTTGNRAGFFLWNGVATQSGLNTSEMWICAESKELVTMAKGTPGANAPFAFTQAKPDGGPTEFVLAGAAGGNGLQDTRDKCAASPRIGFRGSSRHSLLAHEDSLYLAVRAPDGCSQGYIARTSRP